MDDNENYLSDTFQALLYFNNPNNFDEYTTSVMLGMIMLI
jgi:hypothetical protein